MQEQEVNHLARLLITELCLRGSNSLPSVDRLTDDAVHRLRECRPCLVHRNIQKAYRRFIVWLPAYAANTQAAGFVSADAAEQPHQRHSSDHLNPLVTEYPPARVSPTRKTFLRDVQPSPQKLCTVKNIVSVFSAVYAAAVKFGYLKGNPVRSADMCEEPVK